MDGWKLGNVGARGPRGFSGQSSPCNRWWEHGEGSWLSGKEPAGTENGPRESRRGKTPGHLGCGKVQNIHTGGEGLAVRGPQVSDGKLRARGTGGLAGTKLGEGP